MNLHKYTGNNNVETFDILRGYGPELTSVGFAFTDTNGILQIVRPGDTIVFNDGTVGVLPQEEVKLKPKKKTKGKTE